MGRTRQRSRRRRVCRQAAWRFIRSGRWAIAAAHRGRWPAAVSARSASPSVAPVVTMSSTTTMSRWRALLRTERDSSCEVARSGARAEPRLVGRPARHPERLPDGDVDAGTPQEAGCLAGELVDDIGTAGNATPTARRHRHQDDGPEASPALPRPTQRAGAPTGAVVTCVLPPSTPRSRAATRRRARRRLQRPEGGSAPPGPGAIAAEQVAHNALDGRPHPGHAAPRSRSTAAVVRSTRQGW